MLTVTGHFYVERCHTPILFKKCESVELRPAALGLAAQVRPYRLTPRHAYNRPLTITTRQ